MLPDSETTSLEVGDCTLLAEAYQKPQMLGLWGTLALTQEQINARGCALDFVATLKKMRVDLRSLNIKATGSLSEEHPKVYTMIHLVFEAGVDATDVPNVERAIELSLSTYCGVAAMLGKTATITSEVVVV